MDFENEGIDVSDSKDGAMEEKYIAGAVFVEPGGREGVCIYKEHDNPISAKRKADERTVCGVGGQKKSTVTRKSSLRIIYRG